MTEIIKVAIAADRSGEILSLLETHLEVLRDRRFQFSDAVPSKRVIVLAIARMLEALRVDPFEQGQVPRSLDFGHSFSPVIESASAYAIPHGAAVAMDMALSTEIAFLRRTIDSHTRHRILDLLYRNSYPEITELFGLTARGDGLSNAVLLHQGLKDIVLHRDGQLNLVVPSPQLGSAAFVRHYGDLSLADVEAALRSLLDHFVSLTVAQAPGPRGMRRSERPDIRRSSPSNGEGTAIHVMEPGAHQVDRPR